MNRALRAGVITAILILALVLRIGEVERTSTYRPINDAGSYLTLASEIAHTGDYSLSHNPGSGAGGTKGPSAYFAPGYPYFLAAVDVLDGHEVRRDGAIPGARIAQAVLGTITVALVGLVALELLGEVAGLIALALAAVYPVLIGLSATLVAENLLAPLVLAAVWRKPGRSLAAPGLLILATALTVVPWTIRNEIVMHRFIPVSDETGITLVGTYNPASAANRQLPYKWRIFYGIPGERPLIRQASHLTEPQIGDKLQHQALQYISDHPTAPLAAGWHNTLRLFELEGSYAWQASASAISEPISVARTGVFSFWVLCLLALAGAFTRLVSAAPKWIWGVPLLLALSVVVVNVETPRFRAPVDPFLILLASAGLATAAGWLTRRLRRAPVVGEARGSVPARPAELVEMRERLA